MDFTLARHNMVEGQLRPNKVTSPALLQAILELPREHFVPANLLSLSYADTNIRLPRDRVILAPMVLARLIQTAHIKPTDKVLEVGCSTGYATALLARLAQQVVGLENDEDYVQTARNSLTSLGITNTMIYQGDLLKGVPEEAPYDVIMFNGMIHHVPSAFHQQLRDGGRIIALLGEREGLGQAVLFQKREGHISATILFDAAAPSLKDFAKEKEFIF